MEVVPGLRVILFNHYAGLKPTFATILHLAPLLPQRVQYKHLMDQQYKHLRLRRKVPSVRFVVEAKSIARDNLGFRIPQMLSSGLHRIQRILAVLRISWECRNLVLTG